MRRWFVFWLVAGLIFNALACAPDPVKPLPVGPTGGWKVMRPLPVGYNLYDIWGQDSSNVWAVGWVGTIVHWDGEEIRQADSPTHYILKTIDGWAADDIYAGGSGDLIHFDGRTWEINHQFPQKYINDVHCGEDGLLYVCGTMGLVVRDDSGWRTFDGPTGSCDEIWTGPDGFIRVCDGNYLWLVENGQAELEMDFGEDNIKYADGRYLVVDSTVGIDYFYYFVDRGDWQLEDHAALKVRAVLDMGPITYAANSGIWFDASLIYPNDSGRWISNFSHCGDGGMLACGHGGTLLFAELGNDGFQFNDPSVGIGFRPVNVFAGNRCDNIWAGEYFGRVLHFDGEIWTKENSRLSYHEPVTRMQVLSNDWVIAASGRGVSLRDADSGTWNTLPDLPEDISNFHGIAQDSIMVMARDVFHLWNGDSWAPVGTSPVGSAGLVGTPSGQLYTAIPEFSRSSLLRWDGSTFVSEIEIPDFRVSAMCASRNSETLWLGGHYYDDLHNTEVFRYRDGELVKVSTDIQLPPTIIIMTELATDDLFLLAQNQVWRFHQGIWCHENGLPARESYQTLWSLPGCGVFAQGHTTFFKDFSGE